MIILVVENSNACNSTKRHKSAALWKKLHRNNKILIVNLCQMSRVACISQILAIPVNATMWALLNPSWKKAYEAQSLRIRDSRKYGNHLDSAILCHSKCSKWPNSKVSKVIITTQTRVCQNEYLWIIAANTTVICFFPWHAPTTRRLAGHVSHAKPTNIRSLLSWN
jgi:hypothetical protein